MRRLIRKLDCLLSGHQWIGGDWYYDQCGWCGHEWHCEDEAPHRGFFPIVTEWLRGLALWKPCVQCREKMWFWSWVPRPRNAIPFCSEKCADEWIPF